MSNQKYLIAKHVDERDLESTLESKAKHGWEFISAVLVRQEFGDRKFHLFFKKANDGSSGAAQPVDAPRA